jgi:hypothetical protein
MDPTVAELTQTQADMIMHAVTPEEVQQTRKDLMGKSRVASMLIARYPLNCEKHRASAGLHAEGLGTFDVLSLEIQHIVLTQIDVSTLIGFRCVNHKARDVVDSIPEFKKV